MAQPLRSLPPQIKNAPLVVPTRRVKFVRVEVIKASLLIRTTPVHYIIGVAWSNVRSLWVISGHCTPARRLHGVDESRLALLGASSGGAAMIASKSDHICGEIGGGGLDYPRRRLARRPSAIGLGPLEEHD